MLFVLLLLIAAGILYAVYNSSKTSKQHITVAVKDFEDATVTLTETVKDAVVEGAAEAVQQVKAKRKPKV